MARNEASLKRVEELSYRELQAELKGLGLPAKGATEVLKERLVEAWSEPSLHPAGGASKPLKSPAGRRTRPKQEPESAATVTETYVVTTEVVPGSNRRARANAIRMSSQQALDAEDVRVEPADSADDADYVTPLDKVKRLARRSAAGLSDSVKRFQKDVRRRKLRLLWPSLAALAVLLAAGAVGSQWQHSAYWQRQMNAKMDGLQSTLSSVYDLSQAQAARLGQNLHTSYDYVQDGVSSGAARFSDSALGLWDVSSDAASGAFGKAMQYLPTTKRLRAALPTSACCARLNATELDPLLPSGPAWLGVRESLHDAWSGLRDNPLKGLGILLAGSSRSALRSAAAAIERAVPANCKYCYLHIKADGPLAKGGGDAAGALQATLARHLAACPHAIVHVEAVNAAHSDVLPTLLAALSEQGSFFQDGKQVPAYKATYIGSTLVPAQILEETSEERFVAAVKRDLVFQLEVTADPTQLIVPEAFRRRWDVVAPIK